jgi:hypothetical protein
MVSSSWTDDKAVRCLDYWQEHAELDCDKPNFLEIEFNSVIVKVEIFKIVDSLSGMDLFLDKLLDWGDVHEPKVIGVAE